jgi:trehalose/maltose hydrolase-like predicted phosphorylase
MADAAVIDLAGHDRAVAARRTSARIAPGLHPLLDRRFEAVVFDWDGTAVPDRLADAARVRTLVEDLTSAAVDVIVVSGTHVGNVDGQLAARPTGPGRLYLCLNRGSEVFEVDRSGIHLVDRREATPEEEDKLDRSADLTVDRLGARGLVARVVSSRLNRRKIDLIPEPAWAEPPKARLPELLAAVERRLARAGIGSLAGAAAIALEAARAAGLPDAKITSDAKHVEIGLTDKADSARWAFRALSERGIGAGLVLVVGDEFAPLGDLRGSDSLMVVPEAAGATFVSVGPEPGGVPHGVVPIRGGPSAFCELLEDQLERRREGRLPMIDPDPAWTVSVEGVDRERERAHESVLSLADGRFGTAGAPIDDHPASSPRLLVGGVYVSNGPATTLAAAPMWDRSGRSLQDGHQLRRTLDLRTGVLAEERHHGGARRASLRFASLARPGIAALRADGDEVLLPVGPALAHPDPASSASRITETGSVTRVKAGRGGVVAAASEHRQLRPGGASVDRLAAYVADPERPPSSERALRALARAEAAGFDRLLAEQRAAWAARWATADIRIEGDDELDRAVRFALFHLMASVPDSDEAAVGARGISGTAYRGHVFWDSDVFVLPFLAATQPAAARAILEYRVRRLPAAKRAAARLGRAGARFPWESARTGVDVTPRSFRDHAGRRGRILTGSLEEHITADVAWAAETYLAWTADRAFAEGAGEQLLLETARYWASRIEAGADHQGHIRRVIGPDEYHEAVDDNAFTNGMARWNLLRAAARVTTVDDDERIRWRALARRLMTGFDRRTGLYEQFAGFFALEPLVVSEIVPRRPIAADVILGPERTRSAQVVKQADVLMLHHLLPDETRDSLVKNLEFYEPRTAHGSSLSPGIHAALLARAGRLDDAVALLRVAARLDLDDVTGTTAGGLHLAAMGSVWQAVVQGFAGVRPGSTALEIDPRLPGTWRALEVPVTYRGTRVRVRIEHDVVVVQADRPVRVRLADAPAVRLTAGTTRLSRQAGDRSGAAG